MPKTSSASGNRTSMVARRVMVYACGALIILILAAACSSGAPDLNEPDVTFSPTRTATPAG